jgi:PAS domain S-box-containing protein
MLHAKLGNEKADKASIDRWTKQNLSPLFVRSSSGKTAVGSCAAPNESMYQMQNRRIRRQCRWTRTTARAREGRLGQVWRSASPSWIVDATTEPGFLRASAASRALLHGGVIFPILLDTEALGVVEFFSRAARERDAEQLATLSAIGSQIGQFIKRRSAEAALRASEERWRKLFETSHAGMALVRLDGVFTAANPALQRMLGRTEEEIVGRNVLELDPEEERAATADALARYRGGSVEERHVEKNTLKRTQPGVA